MQLLGPDSGASTVVVQKPPQTDHVMNGRGHVPIKLYLQRHEWRAGSDPQGRSLLTSGSVSPQFVFLVQLRHRSLPCLPGVSGRLPRPLPRSLPRPQGSHGGWGRGSRHGTARSPVPVPRAPPLPFFFSWSRVQARVTLCMPSSRLRGAACQLPHVPFPVLWTPRGSRPPVSRKHPRPHPHPRVVDVPSC